MNKVTIKKIPFKLSGETIEKNNKLVFKAEGKDHEDFYIEDIKGMKVISLFPDINTRVCDFQTQEIAKLASQHKDITFISISTDSVEVQKEWCAAKGLENIMIVSDAKYKEFQTKTNAYITKIKKLSRGFILLDEDNIIKEVFFNKEISKDPDYSLLNEWIK